MEKSRTSRRLKQGRFFTATFILGAFLLGACGQHSTVTGVLGVGGVLGTQGFDDSGVGGDQQIDQRPYLALSSADEQKAINDLVPENAGNKQLANQVISATVTRAGIGAEVQIRMTTSNAPLIFKGDLKATNYLTYVGNFPESSGQRSDLTLYVSCSDQSCYHADLFLSDNQGHKAAIVVSTEDRILTTTVPDGETEDQVKGLIKFAQKTKVHYNLTETLPGKSTYTVSTIEANPKDSKILFEGPIQNTESGLVPAQSAILGKNETAALAGIDENSLILNVASTPDPKKPDVTKNIIVNIQAADGVTVRPKTASKKGPTATATVPEQCKAHVTGDVNPMVNDILKECNQKRVNDTMKSWWFGTNKGGFKDFMNLYEASKTAEGDNRRHDFKIMTDTLHANNFPTVWSWVTEVESSFHYFLIGKAGELGIWQIIKGTRDNLGLTNDTAKQIKASTDAALQYYRQLLQSKSMQKDPHNIPMLIAGYNIGQGGVDQGFKVLTEMGQGTDFWKLCNKSLGPVCVYTSKIISGMILSLDPKDYGMTNIGAMEAK